MNKKIDMIHKSRKPTRKQLDFIYDIARVLNKPFRGTSRYDAAVYINNNIEAFRNAAYKKPVKSTVKKTKKATPVSNNVRFQIVYV